MSRAPGERCDLAPKYWILSRQTYSSSGTVMSVVSLEHMLIRKLLQGVAGEIAVDCDQARTCHKNNGQVIKPLGRQWLIQRLLMIPIGLRHAELSSIWTGDESSIRRRGTGQDQRGRSAPRGSFPRTRLEHMQ